MDGFGVPLCFRLQTAVRPMAAFCFLQERGIRMTEKELRRLGRGDLLDLLLEQSRENQHLREQLSDAQDALADKTICIDQAGSIAEASLRLNGVFEAAEEACRQYRENIIRLHQRRPIARSRKKRAGKRPHRSLRMRRSRSTRSRSRMSMCWAGIPISVTPVMKMIL